MAQREGKLELHAVAVEKPEELNVILGQAHFIKTIEDLHEARRRRDPPDSRRRRPRSAREHDNSRRRNPRRCGLHSWTLIQA
jgi:hypothetical protein